ncbi:MAG: protein-export chaperone SecB [Verrucomicrobiota bacterium]|jgi:preprotein translocase subunit SecB
MKALSPLQLQQHFFTHVSVHANVKGTPKGNLNLEPTFLMQKNAENERQWVLVLRVILKSNDPEAPFLYEADIGIQGLVEIHESFPAERREQVAAVNGLSLLYSAIREIVLNVTARSPNGPVCLPTLNFAEVVAEQEAQQKLSNRGSDSGQTSVASSQK